MPNLILTRRPGERVFVGKTLAVTVVSVDGAKVKLSFDAPESIPIDREEVAADRDPDHPLLRQNQEGGGR